MSLYTSDMYFILLKRGLPTMLWALGIIIVASILGNAWVNSKMGRQTISVTGMAQQDFESDLVVWSGSFSRKAATTKEAYAQLRKDQDMVRNFIKTKGISDSEMVFSSVDISENYRYIFDSEGRSQSVPDGFTLRQSVNVESKNLNKVEAISREVSELIERGVGFYSGNPQYYYTKLKELKLDLLANATKDGTERAQSIATNSNSGLGKLMNSNMGIFQITGRNSDEDYTYGGVFNTSSRLKTASVTVRLEFGID